MKKVLALLAVALVCAAAAFAKSGSKPSFSYADIAERLRADCANGTLTQNLNAFDRNGENALYYAIDRNDLELVKAFVKHKAKINRPCNDKGEYPLSVASGFYNHEEIAKYLVEAGAKVKRADKEKNTALHIAAKNGRLGLVKLYLKKGAKLEAKNADGFTPFLCACYEFDGWDGDKIATRRFLLASGANAKAVNAYGQNAFNLLFIDYNDMGLPYLYYPDPDFLKALVAAGADCNRFGKHFETPLIECVAASSTQSGALKAMRELIEIGVDVNLKGSGGETPLIYAAEKGYLAAFSELLERGADRSGKTADGLTLDEYIEKYRTSRYSGFVYDDMRELLDAFDAHDPSRIAVPESARLERKDGKAIYHANVANAFEIVRNIKSDEDTVIRLDAIDDHLRYFDMQCYLSAIPFPVTLDLSECDPTKVVAKLNLYVPNVKRIVYPERKPTEGKTAGFQAYEASNFPDLEELAVPKGVQTIERYSITHLMRLTTVIVPDTVTEIEDEAFYDCPNLERVIVKNKGATIGAKALTECPKARIEYE